MSNAFKDNRLPLVVSAVALAVATVIGIVPVVQDNRRADDRAVALVDVSSLEERVASLENAPPPEVGSSIADIPENAGNARLRQEIDLITRGLANQTGRVSRLKTTVEGIVDENGALVPSPLVSDEIALAKRGLANLTRRINALEDRFDALETAAADITRLQQQMANVDRAFMRLARNSNVARDERASLLAALDALPGGRTGIGDETDANSIEAKLDAILQQLQD
ncbi:hypothetical protein [Yoonia sp. SS1-5]|uniref:Uncharacterized protein n=1 Tax=Yoonia rhodophyticola TaxID=3137370 RepID=A0AAN0M9P9_9RHOB